MLSPRAASFFSQPVARFSLRNSFSGRLQSGDACWNSRISTSTRRAAQKKARSSHRGEPSSHQPVQRPSIPSYGSIASKLALRHSPTLLYRAASNTPYIASCYFVGGTLVAIAAFNVETRYRLQTDELPVYVPLAIVVGSFMIAAMGAWMALKPQNLVKSISSLPSAVRPGSNTVMLRIERSKTIPLKAPKDVTVSSRDITISSPLFLGDDAQVQAALAKLDRQEAYDSAHDKKSILTLPFRLAGYWMGQGFRALRKAFTNEGFILLHIRGNNRTWKVEKDTAWALDDGKTLDRLVKVKVV